MLGTALEMSADFQTNIAIWVALMALALLVDLRTSPRTVAWVALIVLSSVPVLLVSSGWNGELAAASMLRWMTALWFALAAAIYLTRTRWWPWLTPWIHPAESRTIASHFVPHTLFTLAGLGILIVSFCAACLAWAGRLPVGPSTAWPIGLIGNYAGPLVLAAAVLVAFALRERQAWFAFTGALLTLAATTLGWIFHVVIQSGRPMAYLLPLTDGGPSSTLSLLQLGQFNAAVVGLFLMVWLVVVSLYARRRSIDVATLAQSMAAPVRILLATGWILNSLVLLRAARLVVDGDAAVAAALGNVLAWSGWLTCATATVLWLRIERRRPLVNEVALAALSLSALLAAWTAHWDQSGWLAAPVLLTALMISGWLLLAYGWRQARQMPHDAALTAQRRWTAGCVTLAGLLAVIVALATHHRDPLEPAWLVATLTIVAALAITLGAWLPGRMFLYAAIPLIHFAALSAWFEWGPDLTSSIGEEIVQLIALNLFALGALAPLWVSLERRKFQPRDPVRRIHLAGPHRFAAVVTLLGLGLLTVTGLVADFDGYPEPYPMLFAWMAVIGTGLAVASCLWDPRAFASTPGLYLYGLLCLGITLDHFDLPPDLLVWLGTMLLAAWTIGTSYLFSRRAGLRQLADRLGIAAAGHRRPSTGLLWLVPVNLLLVLVVLALAVNVVLTFDEFTRRQLAGNAAVLQTVAVALLARGQRRSALQFAALIVAAAGAVIWSWSWLSPATGDVLHRAATASAALVVMLVLNGLVLAKWLPLASRWSRAAVQTLPTLFGAIVVSVFVVLGAEVWYWLDVGAVPIRWPAIVVTALALVGLMAALLGAALLPGRDPLRLSDRWKPAYVYAAEATAALLFLHIRLSMPWLFRGWFMQYWPLVVLALAFLGVGLGELFRRQQRGILAVPLERTGVLLPLLPVLGFWVVPANVHFTVLMLLVGGLYAALAVMRRSFGFGVLAALAANGGLWYLLQHTQGYGLLEHPQVWLIPPALCVLTAAYLNRDRLNEAQMVTVRYLSATTIYVSSTADIFLNGVAQAPWLPLVLAALALVGIFAGILLRVRAFLILGTTFLVLAVMTMIWHAAVDLDQTWIWWVSGIITGILIIAVFAALEKKRDDVGRLVEQFKQWER